MSTMIQTDSGVYFVSEEPETVKTKIADGEFLLIWWFAPWGQRFKERAWFDPDTVEMIRSEHDD